MIAAVELADAYLALQDVRAKQGRPSGRRGDYLHDGRRAVTHDLDEQTERNLAAERLRVAEVAYRAEVGK